jgi:hypothetical protein
LTFTKEQVRDMDLSEMFPNSNSGCRIADQKRNNIRAEMGVTDINIDLIKIKTLTRNCLKSSPESYVGVLFR